MKIKILLCALASLAFIGSAHAVIIQRYPGLNGLLAEADDVAVVRIEDGSSVPPLSIGRVMADRKCFVLQTLRGDLKNEQQVTISLDGGASLAPMTTHLLFLRKIELPKGQGASYETLATEGTDFPMSRFDNTANLEGDTTKARIQTLIRRYKTYRDEEIKWEDVLLDKAFGE